MKVWELPGARAYVEFLANEAIKKRVLAVRVSTRDASWIATGLRNYFDTYWNRGVVDVDPGTGSRLPQRILLEDFLGIDGGSEAMPDVLNALRGHAESSCLFLSDISGSALVAWGRFATEYLRLTASRPDDALPIILWLGKEQVPSSIPVAQLQVPLFPEDLVLLSRMSESMVGRSRQEAVLMSALCGHLALWDVELACQLAGESLETLCEPSNWLRDWAQEQGWEMTGKADWSLGQVNPATDALHSAWCALDRKEEVICRRVWQAQVSVAFPWLEILRQSMMERGERWLPKAQREQVLELATIDDIFWQQRAPEGLKAASSKARRIRNDLAHLNCIDASRLRWLAAEIASG